MIISYNYWLSMLPILYMICSKHVILSVAFYKIDDYRIVFILSTEYSVLMSKGLAIRLRNIGYTVNVIRKKLCF